MKRVVLLFIIAIITLSVNAVPAKRGQWKTLTLTDGTTVCAELRGDEFAHYYRSENGNCYVEVGDGTYQIAEKDEVISKGASRRANARYQIQKKTRMRVAGAGNSIIGKKKGLIILVQFSDKEFKSNHNLEFYQNVANKKGFSTTEGFNGSIYDYFYDQSLGKFELTFDVVGPVTMPNTYSYYGQNNSRRNDVNVGEMVVYACEQVDDKVNYADYDWDGDGEAEEVFILYAGLGEANGGDENTIWPHMWSIYSATRTRLTLDNTRIDCYACSAELAPDLTSSSRIRTIADGIGTFCHEFSHCLGFPDMYDTGDEGNFGMSVWSLMSAGNYNNNSFTPSGYTAYERWVAGWINPIELKTDTLVSGLKTISEGGDAYIAYNSGESDEVIIWENRQQKGWDAYQYGSGLLVYHIDYNYYVWWNNVVNNNADRQRITIFPADGVLANTVNSLAGDPFPYGTTDKFGYDADQQASWYNYDMSESKIVDFSLTDITKYDDGTVDFTFVAPEASSTAIKAVRREQVVPSEDRVYSIDGRYLGTDINSLGRGIYIVNGKKIVK